MSDQDILDSTWLERLAHLRSLKEPQGGYAFGWLELHDLVELCGRHRSLRAEFAWLDVATPIPPRSRFNFGSEDYVKHVLLEMFGVLANLHSVYLSPRRQVTWVLKGVCPFHRRVHTHNRYCVREDKQGTSLICFHKNQGCLMPCRMIITQQLPLEMSYLPQDTP